MSFALESYTAVPDAYRAEYAALLDRCQLFDEGDTDRTVLLFDDQRLAACGSLSGNVLKQIAVDKEAEGEGACAAVVSALVTWAFTRGDTHLFLCTKPKHRDLFVSLGFFPLAGTEQALLMESRRRGLEEFLRTIPVPDGRIGCVVCNCNPVTNGHLHLIRYAAERVDHLLVFVVSEDASLFPSDVRYALVCEATAGMPRVSVHRSREYLVSRATFPTYFVHDAEARGQVRDDLDLALFGSRIAPALRIGVRFVGEEPYSPVTRAYNARMHAVLPGYGVEVIEIPRYRGISASRVRALLQEGRVEEIRELVPQAVYAYCSGHTS